MPPRRPLPDLCLITAMKFLTPNEQLKASKMSPRCFVSVRAANRTVKTLVITNEDYGYGLDTDIENKVNSFSLASEPSMQQLMDAPGETFPDYSMTTPLNEWNCLVINRRQIRLLDTAAIDQIVTIFSAVTDLKFMTIRSKHIDTLVSLLQHPNWKDQLTNLMVDGTRGLNTQLTRQLISAINGLTGLQLLALGWKNKSDILDLSILAQLKVFVVKSNHLRVFLPSLERNAAINADLQVHLLSSDTEALLTLSQPLRSSIVRYEANSFNAYQDQVPLLCSQFHSLTSLSIFQLSGIALTKVEQLFSALAPLQQLVHLKVRVVMWRDNELPPRPLTHLNSLRALELNLLITSHSQIEWLNLPWTMPNLKIIHIKEFNCGSCKVEFDNCYVKSDYGSWTIDQPEFLDCFRASLFDLHPSVPLNRLIFHSPDGRTSAEELLLQSQ